MFCDHYVHLPASCRELLKSPVRSIGFESSFFSKESEEYVRNDGPFERLRFLFFHLCVNQGAPACCEWDLGCKRFFPKGNRDCMQSTKEHVRKKCLAEMATSPNAPLNASTNSLANSHKLARAPRPTPRFSYRLGGSFGSCIFGFVRRRQACPSDPPASTASTASTHS